MAAISPPPHAPAWRVRTSHYLAFMLNPFLLDPKVQAYAIKRCVLFACDLHVIYSNSCTFDIFIYTSSIFPLNFFSSWNQLLLVSGWAGSLITL